MEYVGRLFDDLVLRISLDPAPVDAGEVADPYRLFTVVFCLIIDNNWIYIFLYQSYHPFGMRGNCARTPLF